MNGYTPAQLNAIRTWTEERDALLRDIGIYSTELEEKTKANAQAGADFAALEKSIAEARGRIAELTALEDRMRTSLPVDIAELLAQKSRLETDCTAKKEELSAAEKLRVLTVVATSDLQSAHNTMKDQAEIVGRVTGELVELSTTHLSEAKELMTSIRTIATEVITKGNENVANTNIVLEKLPRYIFELQKPIPVRRVYRPDHPKFIEPTGITEETVQVKS